MNRYYWTGISRNNRTKAISDITEIIDRYATIHNFQRSSDISLSLLLEVKECDLDKLKQELKKIITIEGDDPDLSGPGTTCIVFFNITFTKGTGNMEIEAPKIPG
jgi:hypothetical protein